jgi:NADH-quinone oxidoreductase subunit J
VEWKKTIFSALASLAGAILCIITILDFKFSATTEAAKEVDMRLIGKSLLSVDYDGYVLPFEVISILLIAAMVAAIVVAKKGGPKKSESQTLTRE